ncbi:hypothetical protein, partial [Lagierella sp.]|uniref:hypothetical protein n=1 Tax=Lagierella sp. TaxID=2849657 RepID=UPI0026267981
PVSVSNDLFFLHNYMDFIGFRGGIMKKIFIIILSLIFLAGCGGVDLNKESSDRPVDEIKETTTEEVSDSEEKIGNPTLEKMKKYTKDVVKDYTQDYTLPLDSIHYTYKDTSHIHELEHKSAQGSTAKAKNGVITDRKYMRLTEGGKPLTEKILKDMDKIFDRAIVDFEKKYPGEDDLHFLSWSLYQNEEEKYVFHGLFASKQEHIWDIYYNVETDIGLKE